MYVPIGTEIHPDDAIVETPSLVTPLLLKKAQQSSSKNLKANDYIKSTTVASLTNANKTILAIEDYYKSSVGELLMDIGLSRVKEHTLKLWKDPDQIYRPERRFRCRLCPFKTEFLTVLEGHLEAPHMNLKKEYLCNWCDYKIKDANKIVFHTYIEHKKRSRIEKPLSNHNCCYCSFETKSKRKMNSHILRCQQFFPHSVLQGPQEFGEFDYPAITSKFITRDDIKTYDKTLENLRLAAYNPHQLKVSGATNIYQPILIIPRKSQSSFQNKTRVLQHPKLPLSSFANGKEAMRTATDTMSAGRIAQHLPCQTSGSTTTNGPNPKGSTFVICEICDGYIKDLNHLKGHMLWIHQVRIHQKMLESRPPLSCQKCSWRFFTDAGLERHLLGAHGLLTSNMQEQVDQGTDSGRCTVCGRVFPNKLVVHMRDVHKTNLKPAALSYKCTVCAATFNLYRLFENHVYSIHQESVSRVKVK